MSLSLQVTSFMWHIIIWSYVNIKKYSTVELQGKSYSSVPAGTTEVKGTMCYFFPGAQVPFPQWPQSVLKEDAWCELRCLSWSQHIILHHSLHFSSPLQKTLVQGWQVAPLLPCKPRLDFHPQLPRSGKWGGYKGVEDHLGPAAQLHSITLPSSQH